MKGWDAFKAHFPGYPGRKIGVFLVLFAAVFLSALAVNLIGFLLPRLPLAGPGAIAWEPFVPILVSPALILVGFVIVACTWMARDRLLREDKARAFQRAFVFPAVGIPLVVSIAFHNVVPAYHLAWIPPRNPLSAALATPLSAIALGGGDWTAWIRIAAGAYFLVTGFVAMARAVQTFGFDYMGLVYLYYPEESSVQDHEIYSVLRHPAYHAIISIAVGLFLVHFTVYQLVDLLCIVAGFALHVRLVEEKELLERFGGPYRDYIREVPAFVPKRLATYFRFLARRG